MTGVIRFIAGDGPGLSAEMLRAAPPEVTFLPEAEYAGVGNRIADYLTGKADTLPDFSEKENAHMADCRGLIALDTGVCLGALAGAAVLILLAFRRRPGRERVRAFGRGLCWSLWIAGGLALVLGIWAAADFDGLFITFHRVAFTNDLWLLDPRTDLLIRLMPIDFFTALGRKGLLMFLPVPLALGVAGFLLSRDRRGPGNVFTAAGGGCRSLLPQQAPEGGLGGRSESPPEAD